MQWEITLDLIFSFTGFGLELVLVIIEEPRCSLRGFFWTRLSLFAKLCLRMSMISLIDCSAKFGLIGSSLIELELS